MYLSCACRAKGSVTNQITAACSIINHATHTIPALSFFAFCVADRTICRFHFWHLKKHESYMRGIKQDWYVLHGKSLANPWIFSL